MRQFIKFSIYTIFFLVTILWLTVTILNHHYLQTLAKHTGKTLFKKYTELDLDYEKLSIEFLPPSISINKIVINHPSNLDLIKIEKISANISLISLFLADPNFDKLNISGLKSSLREKQLKSIIETISRNLSSLPPPKKKTEATGSPLFSRIELIESKLHYSTDTPYNNELIDFDIGVDSIELNFNSFDKFEISISTDFAMSSISKSFFSNTKVTMLADHLNGQISIHNLSIHSDKNEIINSGTISLQSEKNPTIIQLDSNIKKLDFSLLGTFLDIENTYGHLIGNAKSIFKIPNSKEDDISLSISTNAKISNAAIYNYKIAECETVAHIDLNGIVFEKIILKSPNFNLGMATGSLMFNEKINFDFELEPDFLPISEILNVVGVDNNIAVDAILSQGTLNVRGAGSPFLLEISGSNNLSLNSGKTTVDHKIKHQTPKFQLLTNIQIDSQSMRFYDTTIVPKISTQTEFSTSTRSQNFLKINGKINFGALTNLDLKIASHELDLTHFNDLIGFDLSGTLNSEISITQPVNNFSVRGNYKILNFFGLGLNFNSIHGNLLVDNKKMQLEKLDLLYGKSGKFTLQNVILDFGLESTLQIRGKALDVDQFTINKSSANPLYFNIPNASFNLKIPIQRPQKLTGEFKFELYKIVQNEVLYADSLTIEGEISNTNKNIALKEYKIGNFSSHADLAIRKSHIKNTQKTNLKGFPWAESLAFFDISPHDQIKFNFKTVQDKLKQTKNLNDLPFLKENLKSIAMDGNLNLSCEINGSAGEFDGVIKANLGQVSLLGSQWPGFNSTIFFTQDSIDGIFSMSGNSLRGRLKVSDYYNSPSFNLFMIADRFDLRGLLGSKFAQDPRNYLYSKFDLQLEGPLNRLDKIQGEVNIDRIWGGFTQSIGRQKQTINAQLEKPLKFLVQSGMLKEINNQPLILLGDRFYFEALLGKVSQKSNNIVIKSHLDLSILSQLFPEIEAAQGMIETEAQISGSFENPTFFAKIKDNKKSTYNAGEWQPVLLSVHDLRPALRNIILDVEIDQNSIRILQLKAEKGNGTIDVRGEYFFKEEKSAFSNIVIDFFNAKIVYPIAVFKSFEANFTGTTTISGARPPFKIFGDLVINNARNTADFNLRTEILNALRARRVTQSTRMEEPIIEFDIAVKSDRSIDILTKNLVATLSSNLILKGDDTNPILLGNVSIDKGKFVYKRSFELLQSSINFDNSVKIDPILDIRAYSDISPYRVFLNISGETSNPLVEFTVDPPYRPDGSPISTMDILLLVSRGKLPDSNRLSGETQESITSEAVNLLAGYIEEPVEKLFEISGQKVVQQIYIDTFVSEETGATGIRLNLPINISKNFDIVFRSESMKSQSSRVGITADYSLHNNISVSAGLDDIGENRRQSETVDGNVDLKFQFAFP